MELAILLPILAFVALAAGLFVVFRRTDRIVARTREVEGFRVTVHDLAGRIEVSLAGATERIDKVRHSELPPAALADTLTAATDAVERYVDEARELKPPTQGRPIRTSSSPIWSGRRRALSMVEHGTTILVNVRRGNRELEGQTSLKRGYLNLLHARDAIARHAAVAEDLAAAPIGLAGRPRGAPGPDGVRASGRHLTTPCSGILAAHHTM